MRAFRVGLLILLVLIALPEVTRYSSERTLYRAVGLAQVLASGRPIGSKGVVVDRVDSLARAAADGLPGDPRPPMARGAAHLAAGHAREAGEAFGEAIRVGERADALLGLGLSDALEGRSEAARAAFLRAAWISPSLVARIPETERAFVQSEILRLDRLLRSGEHVSIPPARTLR